MPISLDLACFVNTSCILLTSQEIHYVCSKKFYTRSLTFLVGITFSKYSVTVIESYFLSMDLYSSLLVFSAHKTTLLYSSANLSIEFKKNRIYFPYI